jgi:quercetin dioxygenase-like cupin family protein
MTESIPTSDRPSFTHLVSCARGGSHEKNAGHCGGGSHPRSQLGAHVARAQQSGITRTDLQQHDLSIPGREVVQQRVDIGPEAPAVKQTHPGEEIIYILEGTLEYEIGGKVVRVRTGVVLFVPAGTPHTARNIGGTNGAELATYVVEKGKLVK